MILHGVVARRLTVIPLLALLLVGGADAGPRKQRGCAKGVDARLCKHFELFRRQRTAADKPWKGAPKKLGAGIGRLELSHSRRLPSPRQAPRDVMVVPSKRGSLCLIERRDDQTVSTCNPIGSVLRRGLFLITTCMADQPDRTYVMLMVLPDNVRRSTVETAGGKKFDRRTRRNLIFLRTPRSDPDDLLESIRWKTRHGTKRFPLGLSPSTVDERCA